VRQLPETAWNEFAQWFQNGSRAVIVVKIERSLSRDRVWLSSNTREGGVVVSDSAWHRSCTSIPPSTITYSTVLR